MEKAGKRFVAVRVMDDKADVMLGNELLIDPPVHMGHGNRFSGEPTIIQDDAAKMLLNDIIEKNPDQRSELSAIRDRMPWGKKNRLVAAYCLLHAARWRQQLEQHVARSKQQPALSWVQPVVHLHKEDVVRARAEERALIPAEVEIAIWLEVAPLLLPRDVERRSFAPFPPQDGVAAK